MATHIKPSSSRSNAYSESKFTNWTEYNPFFAEARAAAKRFASRIPRQPEFPHIISIRPQVSDFIHPCSQADVLRRLKTYPAGYLHELRAVFLLAGTRKQESLWRCRRGVYGMYWSNAVFLFAHPFQLGGFNLDSLRDFYLDDVLLHEVAHHMDRHRVANKATKEGFAYGFVEQVMGRTW